MSNSQSFKNQDGRNSMSKAPAPSIDLQERTLRVSNYGRKVTESILRELFSQGGPVRKIVFKEQFSFVEFEDPDSVGYCLALFDGVELFGDRLQLSPKINQPKFYNYLHTLKQYEHMFVHNPLQWWNRFGDPTQPCPQHICSYSPSAYNYPATNFDLYNNPNQMMHGPMVSQQMNQQMNQQMMYQMPTSSNYPANFNDYEVRSHTEPRLLRDLERRSFNASNDSRRNDRNNNYEKYLKRTQKKYDQRHSGSKRANTNSSHQANKKMRKHQSF